jgi:hypothetical protein
MGHWDNSSVSYLNPASKAGNRAEEFFFVALDGICVDDLKPHGAGSAK